LVHERVKGPDENDISFGHVKASVFGECIYEGRRHNKDWALIEVDGRSEGRNYLRATSDSSPRPRFRPRNRYGHHLYGVRGIRIGEEERLVRERGRSTGAATEAIHLIWSNVRLEGIDSETLGYAEASCAQKILRHRRFSWARVGFQK